MVCTCVVFGCTARQSKDSGRSFHSFPKDPERCRQWISNVSRETTNGKPWQPSKYSKVCSDHFVSSDFETNTNIPVLKPSAVPSVFTTHPPHKQPKQKTSRRSPKKRAQPVASSSASDPEGHPPAKRLKSNDHNYCYQSMENHLKKTVDVLAKTKEKLDEKNKTIEKLTKKLKRRDNKISGLLKSLAEQQIINSEQHDLLNMNFGEDTFSLIENELKALKTRPNGMRYSEDLKSFAVTLHFYSARAYEYVRKFLHLPHPKTICKWASSRNCNPGFLTEVFETLKTEFSADRADVVLMFDAMVLKKGYNYEASSGTYVGSVNFGYLQTACQDTLASEALVLLVVGLKTHFKQPIGYFLTDKINAEQQAQIVRDGIYFLAEAGYNVCAVVCDGNYTNQSTATALGCKLDVNNMVHAIQNPVKASDTVFFAFDACHLLKNIRNCLGDLKVMFFKDQPIKWEYIVQLHNLQLTDNLVLANKLKGRHILFTKNKMNVKLAAQTLSASVANAIDFLREDLKLEAFQGSEATTSFLRMFDKVFDLCNSTSPMARGLKRPVTSTNFEVKCQEIDAAIEYIKSLKDNKGKAIVTTKRKTGFVGFICTLLTIRELSRTLFNRDNPYKYLLTYRLSQDHLETLFSRIRRKGGWNNNPTPLQFKWALRALLLKNGVMPSPAANCVPLDVDEPISRIFTQEECDSEKPSLLGLSQDFMEVLMKPSVYHDHVLHYICGYISRKIREKLICKHCASALASRDGISSVSSFTARRDNGGLLYASNDMFLVVKEADTSLRRHLIGNQGPIKSVTKLTPLLVTRDVLDKLGGTVFKDIWEHSQNCQFLAGEDDHATQVIKEVCKLFCSTILHHHERIFNERYVHGKQTTSRQKLTKTILFLHL